MKNIMIVFSVLVGSSLVASELSWVDEQVEAIKPARLGMHNQTLSKIKNPFIYLKKKDVAINQDTSIKAISSKVTSTGRKTVYTPSKVHYVTKSIAVSAIMNNSVMINGSWYKVGDKIGQYRVKAIHPKSVLLANSEKKLLLSTKSGNKKIKFLK